MHRFYLIGFMGSGKSFTGRLLAGRLGLPFLDLDDFVEQREGRPIAGVFAEAGEADFRSAEAAALRATAQWPEIVVACGGGTPCFHDNMAWMNAHGKTIYLDAPVETLASRLAPEMDHRPLLQGQTPATLPAFIESRLREREPYYRQAHFVCRWAGQDTVEEIEKLINSLIID